MAVDPKKQLGRPTKYKKEYCEALIEHMKSGYTFAAFGAVAHVGERTLFDWVKTFPEFAEAHEIGKSYLTFVLQNEGHRLIRTGAGNATAWIFFMKNCCGWRNEPAPEPKDADAGEAKGLETGALSDEELRARIAAKLAKLPREEA